jgi:hypothetical protein
LSLSCGMYRKHHYFVSCYDPVEKRPIFVSTIDQVTANAHAIVTLVLCQDVWNTVLGNTRHVEVIRQNFVASTMANPWRCCDFIYHLGAVGMHQLCNFLDLHNFWQNLTFSRCSNCDILDFCHLQTTTLHNSDFLSEYATRMQLLLAGTR